MGKLGEPGGKAGGTWGGRPGEPGGQAGGTELETTSFDRNF